ncbi:PREDICTED: uncharacterized protein LOC109337562 [Lupinus angustifolius]|nr:PREDICTED: uncharacterized protein LOC109337562 [Lupinus angustifolius]
MFPKRFRDPKTGFQLLSSMHIKKYLNKIGFEKEDYLFWKKAGKALLCSYAIIGAVWVYNESSPLDWWPLKLRPMETQEFAHLHERQEFPYPRDKGATKEFTAKERVMRTTSGANGMVGNDKSAPIYQKEIEGEKFDQEAQKVWLGMRDEVIAELKEKGFDVK